MEEETDEIREDSMERGESEAAVENVDPSASSSLSPSGPNHDDEKGSEDDEYSDEDYDSESGSTDYEEEFAVDDIRDEEFFDEFSFATEQRRQRERSIRITRKQLERVRLEKSKLGLEESAAEEAIQIGKIPVRDLNSIHRQMEKAQREEAALIDRLHNEELRSLNRLEEESLSKLVAEEKKKRDTWQEMEKERKKRHEKRVSALRHAFGRAKEQLHAVMDRRDNEVSKAYGVLRNAEMEFGGVKGRRAKFDWSKYKQRVEVKVELLRGVGEKLPQGRYMILVSLYERLGGTQIPWRSNTPFFKKKEAMTLISSCPLHDKWTENCEACLGLVAATFPVRHSGKFDDVELKVGQSVFCTAPSRKFMKPYTSFVFELILLKGRSSKHRNLVVGWGAFPFADPRFNVVKGRYRIPLLRGGIDSNVNNYQKFEEAYSQDLSRWLTNLYFEVIHLPRIFKKKKEYEYEQEFTQDLLGLVQRDIENPIDASDSGFSEESASEDETWGGSQVPSSSRSKSHLSVVSPSMRSKRSSMVAPKFTFAKLMSQRSKMSRITSSHSHGSPRSSEGIGGMDTSDEKKIQVLHFVLPGLTYFEHGNDEAEIADEFDSSRAGLGVAHRKARIRRQQLTHAQKLERYQFNVRRPKGYRDQRESSAKVGFMARALVSDMGLTQWKTLEFWATLFMFLIVVWARLYSHYFGQWLFLKAVGVPINEFDPELVTFKLGYDARQLTVWVEIGVIFAGCFFNIFVLVFLIFLAFLSQVIAGSFFDFGSRFLTCLGFAVILDEIFLLIVDASIGNEHGDAFKLYHYYEFNGNEGYLGVMLTILIFIVIMVIASFIVYHYLLRIHMNGLMHDVYVRLRKPATAFFMPHDFETTPKHVRWLCRKAEAWRGKNGERRKIIVFDYVTQDENDPDFSETTTHLAIFQLDVKQQVKKLWRQYLRLPDGTLLEVFQSLEDMGSKEYALLQRALAHQQHLQGGAGGGVQQLVSLNDFLEGRLFSKKVSRGISYRTVKRVKATPKASAVPALKHRDTRDWSVQHAREHSEAIQTGRAVLSPFDIDDEEVLLTGRESDAAVADGMDADVVVLDDDGSGIQAAGLEEAQPRPAGRDRYAGAHGSAWDSMGFLGMHESLDAGIPPPDRSGQPRIVIQEGEDDKTK